MRIAGVFALVLSASAQTYSSHTGWRFTDTIETANDVLVADITAGSAVDTGSQFTVQATLNTVRILRGDIAPGTDFTLQWHYRPRPRESPAVTTKVLHTRGLWFLRKNPDGGLEPMQAGVLMAPMGGSFLPLGSSAPSYADDEPLQAKIAREIGAALEDLVAEHSADLDSPRRELNANRTVPAWIDAGAQYQSLTMALQSLHRAAAGEVYQLLSTLPDPHLKTLGIFGRLGAGDTAAVPELEKNLPTVLSASAGVHAYPFPPFLGSLDLKNDLPAAHALARIALSDTTIQGLDGNLAFALVRTRSPEMLPYLIVMLQSPNPGIRGSALMGFCQLLGPMPTPTALWSPEMAGYCPNGWPINDRELERKDIQFWTGWWESHRDQIAKTVALPDVTPPARYSGAVRQSPEIPRELRFEVLVHMATRKPPDHYHAADGTIVEGPPVADVPHDPVSRQLDSADREIFRQAIESVSAKLAAVQERGQQIGNAARITGTMPSREQSKALEADHMDALRSGLAELQSKLSPDGWQAVERFFKNMGGAGVIMTTVAK